MKLADNKIVTYRGVAHTEYAAKMLERVLPIIDARRAEFDTVVKNRGWKWDTLTRIVDTVALIEDLCVELEVGLDWADQELQNFMNKAMWRVEDTIRNEVVGV
jgi:hypothetical protein